jgi:glucokinase
VILAGDIGGTKTVLALFEESGAELAQRRESVYPSREHVSFDEILRRFTAEAGDPAISSACFGVAGAVVEGSVRTTNLPWQLTEPGLSTRLGAPVKLLNDLEAAAYGMLFLPDEEIEVLCPGSRERGRGNMAVIAAGTGLGEAMLYFDGERHHPIATEGGHADFAARDEREIALLRHLQEKLGAHVSYEQVLSGPGLYNVYEFARASSGNPEPGWLSEQIRSGDPSAAVSQAGLEGKDPVCEEALGIFVSVYGAEAGNMALRCMALGGVFVGGGIAPKILPLLRGETFRRAFLDKGRFSGMLEGIELAVSLNPRAPLIGSARYAQRL